MAGSCDSIPNKILEEITVTATYGATGISNAVVPVRIISLDRLSALGIQNVSDALKYQANIRLQQDNIIGTSLSMQGLSGENVKILIDGMPLTGRQNGNIDLSQLNLHNVERIEIVEGPLSVQYGTNALAGTINIITKKLPTKTIDYQANSYYEAIGTYNTVGSVGWRDNHNSVIVSGGRNFFDGWSANTEDLEQMSARFQDWKPKIQYFTDANYSYKKDRTKIGYTGNYFTEFILNRGRPLLPYNEYAFDDTYKTRRYLNGLNMSYAFENKRQANLLVSYSVYQRYKNTYYRNLINLSQVLTENLGDQDTTRFNLISARGTFVKSNKSNFKYETGFDINVETGLGLRIAEKEQTIGDYAAFVSAEWKIKEGITLRPGLRFSYNTSYKAPLIPSLHLRWALSEDWILRTSYGSGFRAPGLKELYFYFVDINHNIQGNKNLLAEKSHSVNSVLTYKKAVGSKKVYKIEGSSFLNDVHNLITLAILPIGTGRGGQNEYGYINIGHLRTMGCQLFAEAVLNNLTLAGGASYMERQNIFEMVSRWSNTWEARGNIVYNLADKGWSLNGWYKYSAKQPSFVLNEEGAVLPTFIAGYSMADVGVSKKLMKNKLSISAGIKNLFNVKNIQSQLVSSGHSSSDGSSPLATGRFFFTKCEIRL